MEADFKQEQTNQHRDVDITKNFYMETYFSCISHIKRYPAEEQFLNWRIAIYEFLFCSEDYSKKVYR